MSNVLQYYTETKKMKAFETSLLSIFKKKKSINLPECQTYTSGTWKANQLPISEVAS
jgi:hypothetical protein